MPLPIYAKFDGIDGSSKVKGREKTVECLAMDHIVEIPVDEKDSSATGARRHGAMKLTANVDKAYVNLMKHCTTSKPIKTVTVDFFEIDETGKQKKYLTTKMENSRVTGVRTYVPDVDDKGNASSKHRGEYELRYEKITWTYHDGNIEHSDEWKKPVE